MQAIILSAGKGTRTHPLTLTRPKPLLTIMNKTILEHNLEQLQGIITEAIIVIGYKSEMIKKKIGNQFGNIKITYVEQKEQLGPGHALIQCKDLIDNRFMVINGDDFYSSADIKNCLKHHYCVLAKKVPDPEHFGIFVLKNNKVEKIVEKPKQFISDLANVGLYVFDRKIFGHELEKTERNEYEITDYVGWLAKNNDVYLEKVQDYWFPVSFSWSLIDINKFFVDKIKKSVKKGKIEKGVFINGNIILGKGSILKSGTYIEGNVVIGENTVIGPNAYIRGSTSIGDNCKVGQAVEIKNCIIMNNSKVPHLSYIGDSVIGENVNLGAGTITGNLRHDNADIKSMVNDKLIDSGRRKFGTIVGDNVHTGIHTSIYPGRKIWPDKSTAPGEIVKKDII